MQEISTLLAFWSERFRANSVLGLVRLRNQEPALDVELELELVVVLALAPWFFEPRKDTLKPEVEAEEVDDEFALALGSLPKVVPGTLEE